MVMKRLLRNPLSMIGLLLLLGFVLVAVFAPWIAPTPEINANNPYRVPRYGWGNTPEPPSPQHPMGLTHGKYDIFCGIVWGTRTAFQVTHCYCPVLSNRYCDWLNQCLYRREI